VKLSLQVALYPINSKKFVHYLIFDFDGVIADTYETVISAHLKYGSKTTREEAIAEMATYFSNKPNHTRAHTNTDKEMAAIQKWTTEFGQIMHDTGFKLFSEFVHEIEKIDTPYKAIVSSGSSNYVVPSIKNTRINPTHILAYEDHHSKEEKIETVCKEWNISVSEVYYFTDSLADVYELQNMIAPDKLIGVSWGFCSFQMFSKELKEECILKDFKDIHTVL
jgi:phosphoglycolate phosphatase-like HAD superfamily hydrolase